MRLNRSAQQGLGRTRGPPGLRIALMKERKMQGQMERMRLYLGCAIEGSCGDLHLPTLPRPDFSKVHWTIFHWVLETCVG